MANPKTKPKHRASDIIREGIESQRTFAAIVKRVLAKIPKSKVNEAHIKRYVNVLYRDGTINDVQKAKYVGNRGRPSLKKKQVKKAQPVKVEPIKEEPTTAEAVIDVPKKKKKKKLKLKKETVISKPEFKKKKKKKKKGRKLETNAISDSKPTKKQKLKLKLNRLKKLKNVKIKA